MDYLANLGVLYYRFTDEADVNKLALNRSYKNRDVITVSPEKMGDLYEEKVKMFFNEHLHEDEEIRYIRDGTGFFDVRSDGDEWVRILLEKDDLIVSIRESGAKWMRTKMRADSSGGHLSSIHDGQQERRFVVPKDRDCC